MGLPRVCKRFLGGQGNRPGSQAGVTCLYKGCPWKTEIFRNSRLELEGGAGEAPSGRGSGSGAS